MTKSVIAQVRSGCWIIRTKARGAICHVVLAGSEGEAIIVIAVFGIRRAKPEPDGRACANPTTSLMAASPIPTMIRRTMGGGAIAATLGSIHLLTASAIVIDRCSVAITVGAVLRHITFLGHVVLRHVTSRLTVTNRLATFNGDIVAGRSGRFRGFARHRRVLRCRICRNVRRVRLP